MYRIEKIFEENSVVLIKIEGALDNNSLSDWTEALENIQIKKSKLIIDFCYTSFIDAVIIKHLLENITDNTLLLNCPNTIKNIFHAAGLSKNILA